jgi:plasmid stabilization system protein ParE
MAEVKWTRKATSQLERAIKYIKEEQGPTYAQIVLSRILNSTSHLSSHPKMGPKEPLLEHKKHEYRFLVAWSYKIIYKVAKNDNVTIMRVFHTSQDPSKLTF